MSLPHKVLLAGLVLVFAMPATAAYPDVVAATSGLVSYWRLNDGGSSFVNDSAGGSLGAAQNTTSVPGALNDPADTGFGFDGASSSVSFDPSKFGQPPSVTIETWVKINSTKPSGGIHFLLTDSSSDFSNGFTLSVNDADKPSVDFEGATELDLTASSALPHGTWAYVVATFDGSNNTGALYVNGTQNTSGNLSGGINYQSNGGLLLGKQYKSSNQSTRYLDGALDEVALYNRALTSVEIQAHYQAGLAATQTAPPPDAGTAPTDAGTVPSTFDAGTSGVPPQNPGTSTPSPGATSPAPYSTGNVTYSENSGCSTTVNGTPLVSLALLCLMMLARKLFAVAARPQAARAPQATHPPARASSSAAPAQTPSASPPSPGRR